MDPRLCFEVGPWRTPARAPLCPLWSWLNHPKHRATPHPSAKNAGKERLCRVEWYRWMFSAEQNEPKWFGRLRQTKEEVWVELVWFSVRVTQSPRHDGCDSGVKGLLLWSWSCAFHADCLEGDALARAVCLQGGGAVFIWPVHGSNACLVWLHQPQLLFTSLCSRVSPLRLHVNVHVRIRFGGEVVYLKKNIVDGSGCGLYPT